MKQISENEFEWDIEKGDNPNTKKSLSSRRDFLKKLGLAAGGAVILGTGGKLLYNALSNNNKNQENEETIKVDISSFKDKPIHLGYQPIVQDKDIAFLNDTGSKFSPLSRVSRCLRRKPLTDVVEDRYGIPRGLLMAMMAQEGMGDPTMPNLSGDGGLGLIHIQAANAHDFGLKTLPRFTSEMRDTKHGDLIDQKLQEHKHNLAKLIDYDDRFHPVMAVDVAARFLMNCKSRVGGGTDGWIHALKRYSGREYTQIIKKKGKSVEIGYGLLVVQYRAIINDITGDGFPKDFSRNIYKDIDKGKKIYKPAKDSLSTLKFVINGEKTGYEGYLAYFEESMQNFELQKYMKIGTYQENIDNKNKKIPIPENRKIIPENTLITSEFVDTKQHNSEGFRLYRYQVKKGDTPLSISDNFDDRDKQKGDKYANTGNLNIVRINGKLAENLKEGQVIYVKVRNE